MVVSLVVAAVLLVNAATASAQDFGKLLEAVDKIEIGLKKLITDEAETRSSQFAQLEDQIKAINTSGMGGEALAQLQKDLAELKAQSLTGSGANAVISESQLIEIQDDIESMRASIEVLAQKVSVAGSPYASGGEPPYSDLQKEIEWMKLEIQSLRTFADINSPKLASLDGLSQPRFSTSPTRQVNKPGPKYNNLRYDDNCNYLDDPSNRGNDLFDPLKRIPLGGNSHISFGGGYRFRLENDNRRKLGASDPESQELYLNRLFLFADLQLIQRFRLFTEFKYAGIRNNKTPVGAITHDRPDIENLFIDGWFVSNKSLKFGARVGRQELQYGKQRLISPLDWANTRRTFDGFKLMSKFSGWSIDGFVTRPVKVNPTELNAANNDQLFAGLYSSKKLNIHKFSGYLLLFNFDSPGGASGDFQYWTLGTGYDGKAGRFDWTSEIALQFGSVGDKNVSAFMLAMGGGYQYKEHPWKPRIGVSWDMASGDSDPNDNKVGTFNQHFPLGHAFLGWADQVGRQNINSISVQLSAKPSKTVVTKLNWFSFNLAQKKDALYNAGGKVSRLDLTGQSGGHVGNELDALIIFKLSRHASFHVGYLHFAPGSFMADTGASESHNMLYMMLPVKF